MEGNHRKACIMNVAQGDNMGAGCQSDGERDASICRGWSRGYIAAMLRIQKTTPKESKEGQDLVTFMLFS